MVCSRAMGDAAEDIVHVEEPIEHGHEERRPAWISFAQTAAGLAVVFITVGIAGHFVRDDLERLGRLFMDRFGYPGMALGTFMADGLHFPIPPQFYMLANITGSGTAAPALLALSIGSITGGHVARWLAEKASRLAFVRRRAAHVARRMRNLIDRFGTWAIVLASLTPVPYSFLCYLAGINRLPYRLFALLCVLRVPKIAAYYFLIQAGWSLA